MRALTLDLSSECPFTPSNFTLALVVLLTSVLKLLIFREMVVLWTVINIRNVWREILVDED